MKRGFDSDPCLFDFPILSFADLLHLLRSGRTYILLQKKLLPSNMPGSGLRIQQFVQHDFTVNISLNFAIILEGERTLSTLQILSVFQTQITGKHPSFPNESVEEE